MSTHIQTTEAMVLLSFDPVPGFTNDLGTRFAADGRITILEDLATAVIDKPANLVNDTGDLMKDALEHMRPRQRIVKLSEVVPDVVKHDVIASAGRPTFTIATVNLSWDELSRVTVFAISSAIWNGLRTLSSDPNFRGLREIYKADFLAASTDLVTQFAKLAVLKYELRMLEKALGATQLWKRLMDDETIKTTIATLQEIPIPKWLHVKTPGTLDATRFGTGVKEVIWKADIDSLYKWFGLDLSTSPSSELNEVLQNTVASVMWPLALHHFHDNMVGFLARMFAFMRQFDLRPFIGHIATSDWTGSGTDFSPTGEPLFTEGGLTWSGPDPSYNVALWGAGPAFELSHYQHSIYADPTVILSTRNAPRIQIQASLGKPERHFKPPLQVPYCVPTAHHGAFGYEPDEMDHELRSLPIHMVGVDRDNPGTLDIMKVNVSAPEKAFSEFFIGQACMPKRERKGYHAMKGFVANALTAKITNRHIFGLFEIKQPSLLYFDVLRDFPEMLPTGHSLPYADNAWQGVNITSWYKVDNIAVLIFDYPDRPATSTTIELPVIGSVEPTTTVV